MSDRVTPARAGSGIPLQATGGRRAGRHPLTRSAYRPLHEERRWM